jgi:hypothetical protein
MKILDLIKGITFVIGSINVQADVVSDNGEIIKVYFELLEGENEQECGNDERLVISNYSDYDPPYEWLITEKCLGWNTIRATVFDEEGNFASDEIEIWFFNI